MLFPPERLAAQQKTTAHTIEKMAYIDIFQCLRKPFPLLQQSVTRMAV
jgi:hypothetical protein